MMTLDDMLTPDLIEAYREDEGKRLRDLLNCLSADIEDGIPGARALYEALVSHPSFKGLALKLNRGLKCG
jgi:hypothetical protein